MRLKEFELKLEKKEKQLSEIYKNENVSLKKDILFGEIVYVFLLRKKIIKSKFLHLEDVKLLLRYEYDTLSKSLNEKISKRKRNYILGGMNCIYELKQELNNQ